MKSKPVEAKKDIEFKGTMTWNYRVMRYDTGELGVHEAYYDDGKVNAWTQSPIIVADSIDELLDVLERIKKDILRSKDDILPYEKLE